MAQTQMEPIITALHDFIQQERKRNFHFLDRYSHIYTQQKDLLVATRANAYDVGNLHSTHRAEIANIGHKVFKFLEPLRGDEFERIFAVLIRPGDAVTVDNMVIIEFGQTKKHARRDKAIDWLRNTYCGDKSDTWAMQFSEVQYHEQNLWWNSTGQTFQFLELPAELRVNIYLQSVGPVVVPDRIGGEWDYNDRLTLGTGQSIGDTKRPGITRDPDIPSPNLSIFRVNKQIYHEAREVAICDTTKRFSCLRGLRTGPRTSANHVFEAAVNYSPDPKFLRNAQLEMTAAQYFAFIGFVPMTGAPFARASTDYVSIRSLHNFKNLTTLDFRFISPKHPSAICPFACIQSRRTPPQHSCQKKWIDLFFTLAFNSLRTLITGKSITITTSGCIKTSSKNYWEYVLNDKREDHTAEIKNMEKLARKKKKHNDGPLKCECTYPCAGDLTPGVELFQCEDWVLRQISGLNEMREGVYWGFDD
ncbi:hypothetical protein PTT_11456 [Pyrenophora teres f. teres 0-1]|uniref:Uncharacterized protein n=1 Tax=Pyrenophora teres f. teres (strain 0-1) TaxID=861557 RepID=E3RRK9_PYRTT|nr:hypothetical protein PTT_11456 [Pyrenophora teres f. teres 0-1]